MTDVVSRFWGNVTSQNVSDNADFSVSWKKAKAKGYQVVYSKKAKKAYKTFKNVKKNKAVKKLKKGKFFIKVRAYNVKANGKKLYSAYSSAKKVVVK